MKKNTTLIFSIIAIFFFGCNNPSSNHSQAEKLTINSSSNSELTFESAHSNAQAILKEDFYWSPIEESSPFGNDAGSDALYGFREWRINNNTASPTIFLNELLSNWAFPKFDLYEIDSSKIVEYINANTSSDQSTINMQYDMLKEHFQKMALDAGKEFDEDQFKEILANASTSMGDTYLIDQDNAIIGIGFGQYVLEGRIDNDIKNLTRIAIQRELLPILIQRFGANHVENRKTHLKLMLDALDEMNN